MNTTEYIVAYFAGFCKGVGHSFDRIKPIRELNRKLHNISKNKLLLSCGMSHLDGMMRILVNQVSADNPNLKDMEYLDCAEKAIRLMIPGGEYNRYYDDLMDIAVYKAQIYAYSDPEKAIEELKKAREYAVTFDDLFMRAPTVIPFHSPFFNALSYDSANLLVYGPLEENRRIDNFKWWLSGRHFDGIRERSDFRQLVNS